MNLTKCSGVNKVVILPAEDQLFKYGKTWRILNSLKFYNEWQRAPPPPFMLITNEKSIQPYKNDLGFVPLHFYTD